MEKLLTIYQRVDHALTTAGKNEAIQFPKIVVIGSQVWNYSLKFILTIIVLNSCLEL